MATETYTFGKGKKTCGSEKTLIFKDSHFERLTFKDLNVFKHTEKDVCLSAKPDVIWDICVQDLLMPLKVAFSLQNSKVGLPIRTRRGAHWTLWVLLSSKWEKQFSKSFFYIPTGETAMVQKLWVGLPDI